MKGTGVTPQVTTRAVMDTFGFSFTLRSDTWMGKGPIYQPTRMSDFGKHSCCFGTLCGDYLDATWVPQLQLHRRTPFGVTMRLHVKRLLHSTCLVLPSKQYLHIHYIINRLKWLQCFKININMLPVDPQRHLMLPTGQKQNGTWSVTSQPLLALIVTAAISEDMLS